MKYFYSVLLLLILFNPQAWASDSTYGYFPSLYNIKVNDPNGSTATVSDSSALGFAYRYDISRINRFTILGEYFDTTLNASTTNIGQHIKSVQVTGLYERNLKFSRTFNNIYVGGGGFIGKTTINARHTVDNAGYLLNVYPDRSFQDYGLAVSAGADWKLSQTFDLGLLALYQHSFNNGINGYRVGFTLFYTGF